MNRQPASGILISAVTILIGILCLILKADVISIALTTLGISLLVLGILKLIHGNQPGGITELVIGLIIILMGWTFISLALSIIAILMIVYGISDLVRILRFRPPFMGAACLSPILTAAAGLVLFFNQGGTLNGIFIAVGIMLVIDGIVNLFCSLQEH